MTVMWDGEIDHVWITGMDISCVCDMAVEVFLARMRGRDRAGGRNLLWDK